MVSTLKSYRENKIRVKSGQNETIYFNDTTPNYAHISNPTNAALFVGSTGNVSPQTYDQVIGAYGSDVFTNFRPLVSLTIFNNSAQDADIIVKSWEGDFDPGTLPRSFNMTGAGSDGLLGVVDLNVIHGALPSGDNTIGGVMITEFNAPLPVGAAHIGSVTVQDSQFSGLKSFIVEGQADEYKTVSLQPGYVFYALSDNQEITLYNGTTQLWKKADVSIPNGIYCNTSIRIHFAAADKAYILYKEVV